MQARPSRRSGGRLLLGACTSPRPLLAGASHFRARHCRARAAAAPGDGPADRHQLEQRSRRPAQLATTRCAAAIRSGRSRSSGATSRQFSRLLVSLSQRLDVLLARLLHDGETLAHLGRQTLKRRRHSLGEEARALAAAEDEEQQPASRLRRLVGDIAIGQHRRRAPAFPSAAPSLRHRREAAWSA